MFSHVIILTECPNWLWNGGKYIMKLIKFGISSKDIRKATESAKIKKKKALIESKTKEVLGYIENLFAVIINEEGTFNQVSFTDHKEASEDGALELTYFDVICLDERDKDVIQRVSELLRAEDYRVETVPLSDLYYMHSDSLDKVILVISW